MYPCYSYICVRPVHTLKIPNMLDVLFDVNSHLSPSPGDRFVSWTNSFRLDALMRLGCLERSCAFSRTIASTLLVVPLWWSIWIDLYDNNSCSEPAKMQDAILAVDASLVCMDNGSGGIMLSCSVLYFSEILIHYSLSLRVSILKMSFHILLICILLEVFAWLRGRFLSVFEIAERIWGAILWTQK